jgi:DNA-3-methyladenine glycosylase II
MHITSNKSLAIGREISRIEPRFAEVVAEFAPCPIGVTKSRESNFAALASSILSQQLSVKAAATITDRVRLMAGGRLDPKQIAKSRITELRGLGCSATKARALLELAQKSASGELPIRSLHRKSDAEIEALLLPLHGIGKWTVEMFLIFQLGRVDIWPVGDFGVRRGWEKIFGMRSEISPERLAVLGEKFAPYRSHLAWYCWRAHSIYE